MGQWAGYIRACGLLALSLSVLIIIGCSDDRGETVDASIDAPSTVKIDAHSSVGDITVDLKAHDLIPHDSVIDQFQHISGNSLCALAEEVILFEGEASVSGDTSLFGYANEFPVRCNAASTADILDGPQAYYKFLAVKDQWYKLVLAPSFTAYIYTFTSGCSATAIETDCQSGGATGSHSRFVPAGTMQAIYIKAPADDYIFAAVDSESPDRGPFTLEIMELETPTNGTCATAEHLLFSGTKVAILGNTGPALTPDEHPALKCGQNTFKGPQAYYKWYANMYSGYVIELIASEAQYIYLYVFSGSCDEVDISTDCSSSGATGDALATSIGGGQSATLVFAPPEMGWYHIAIDSAFPYNHGGFTLAVVQK